LSTSPAVPRSARSCSSRSFPPERPRVAPAELEPTAGTDTVESNGWTEEQRHRLDRTRLCGRGGDVRVPHRREPDLLALEQWDNGGRCECPHRGVCAPHRRRRDGV